jgi:hypothetical protein
MTNSQKVAMEKIKKLTNDLLYNDNHEIKKFEVTDCDYFISVVVETGLKNDEGTLVAIVGRDRAHLFIGKRGAITYPVYKKGKFIRRKFHGYSMLEAVCDQRKEFEI